MVPRDDDRDDRDDRDGREESSEELTEAWTHGWVDAPPASRWSRRMPSSVAGLVAGAAGCVLLIALSVVALVAALNALVAG